MLLKKRYTILFLLFLFFVFPSVVFADPTCCVSHGGEYACNTATSQLYCADGTISTDCTCRIVATPTPSPTATPVPIAPSPACPALSTYDTSSQTCKCDTGYIVNGNTCVTYTNFCWTKYGGNANYDTTHNTCRCSQGYTWNDAGTSCISLNDVCHNKLGNQSYFNSDNNTCNCFQGYAIYNNKCQPIPTQAALQSQNTSMPIPTASLVPTETLAPSPTVTVNPLPTSSDLLLKGNGENYSVSVNKNKSNALVQILENIWHFILHLFSL